ncbi:MAG TPA: hypothetical protein VED17_00270 [Nitrososphaerales archaeon]|nr:hypothetical protein [Nitrososphaerales archaeon]
MAQKPEETTPDDFGIGDSSESSPMKKTNIQMSLRLTYPRFREYLQWMLEHQLAAET